VVHDHPHKHSVSVSAIIFNDQGQVLATKRRDTGAWVPPGGVLELHEPIEDGLRREVREEAGLEIHIGRLTGVYKNTATGVLSLAFRCHASSGVEPRVSEETTAAEWLTVSDATQRMTEPFAIRVIHAQLQGPTFIMSLANSRITAARAD
jgi:8-oxo-dGTP pyrophosphatase MutT (NUDIX family)